MKEPCVIRFRMNRLYSGIITTRYIRDVTNTSPTGYRSTIFRRAAYVYYNIDSATIAYNKLLIKVNQEEEHTHKLSDIVILRRIRI